MKYDKNLGPFMLPDPKQDYPVDYVLDGQQRITSVFGVFQTQLVPSAAFSWLPIYFDLSADVNVQESQFVALKQDQVDHEKHFPLSTFFDTTAYRAATRNYSDDVVARIDKIQEVFKETKIPVQTSRTEDKATVAIIFERVNRQGIELDTLQLLAAWTWSEEFQLQDQFSDLSEELKPFGFADVGGDTDLLLRCCAAVLAHDASPQALMSLQGSVVRENFDKVTNGVKYAVEYLRTHFKTETLNNLPSTSILIPLSVFFSVSGNKEATYTQEQSRKINRWFWRASFSKRYSSAVLRNLNSDIQQIINLRDGKESSLGNFPASIGADFFIENLFNLSTVNTKTFVLMLASEDPRSFVSGQKLELKKTLKDSNRTEYHHLMPRGFIEKSGQDDSHNENILANFCFLSRADNRKLGGDAPSIYKSKMPTNFQEILASAFCPNNLFEDDFDEFVKERNYVLYKKARELCQVDATTTVTEELTDLYVESSRLIHNNTKEDKT